ncbi:MAG: hypothetical protein WCA31_01450 [Acidimicrobiales bacterium]
MTEVVASRARGARSEAGDTLIEVLLALIVLALASVALITAFQTDISASSEHRKLANFDTALASSMAMVSSVIQDGYANVFSACPTPVGSLAGYPSSNVLTAALNINGYTAQIAASGTQSAVEYSDGGSFIATCVDPTATTPGNVSEPQLINVVVTDTATGLSHSDTVVVVDPTPVQTTGANSSTPTQVLFTTEPEGATVGAPFTTQPVLKVLAGNTLVTTDLSSITLSITPGQGTFGAVLSSTCSGSETSGIVTFSGCSINEAGTGYELTATYGSGTNQLSGTSAPFNVYSAPLATATITSVTPSTTTAGALTISFTAPDNAPVGETYTAKACTDVAMSLNCSTPSAITSGGSITGLTQGSSYYVQITATATANYLASTTPPYQPAVMATVQLQVPGTPTITAGTVAGSLSVNFAAPAIVAANQTYTVNACTNKTMSSGCVSNTNYTPGSNLTGLGYTPGGAGDSYYVDVIANASTGYLVSPPTTPVLSPVDESAVKTPTGFSTAPSASQAGSITAAFSEPTGGVGPTSFTATACTNAAMTNGCITVANYTSGSQLSGLTPGSSYYVTITAVSTTVGYASATTAVSSATIATVQLMAPTGVSATYGTQAGSISVLFTPPVPAATGQTYTATACTNVTMMTGCVTNTSYTEGANLTGLKYTVGSAGTTYYVEVTANPSSGFLVSAASSQVSQADTSQLAAPTGVTLGYGATAGSISVSFTPPGTVAAGQTYSVTACTNTNMNAGCVTNSNFTSGSSVTGLPFPKGSVGTTYYVEVTANSSAAYVASSPSAQASHAETSQLDAPTVTLNYGATAGSILVSFTPQGTVAGGQTYTMTACTNTNMNAGCVTNSNFTSGSSLTGLPYTQGSVGTTYYVEVTSNSSAAYVASAPSTQASQAETGQVAAPGTPVPTTSTTRFSHGAIVVTFSHSTGVTPLSYTATACLTQSMNTGCVTVTTYTSGAQFTGLVSGTSYWVEVTAIGTTGYLNSAPSVSTTSAKAS